MKLKVFNISDESTYRNQFASIYDRLDVCYNFPALNCDALASNGEAEIFTIIDKDDDVFIYPYIKQGFGRLRKELEGLDFAFDIVSPYGYAGPFTTNSKKKSEFEKIWLKYSQENNFVTEFIRYHPFCSNFFSQDIQNVDNREMVVLDLAQDWDKIWTQQFSATNRNLIKKLERENFQCDLAESDQDFLTFISLYRQTMRALDADSFYLFPDEFFWSLKKNLGSNLKNFAVSRDGVTYASALFFASGSYFTYHLSGRDQRFSKIPATNFLIYSGIKWAKDQGIKYLILGGGHTTNPQDPLLKFKGIFSKERQCFTIGKRILNLKLYEAIVEHFIAERGEEDYSAVKHILQFYRFNGWLEASKLEG